MSKIILKNIDASPTPLEGQTVIYSQNGSLKSVSHGGSPSSLSMISTSFLAGIYVNFPESPATDYYSEEKSPFGAFPLASNAVITSAAVYASKSSYWNTPLSIRAARGDSEASPVVGSEILEMPIKIDGGEGYYQGSVYTATGLNISMSGGGYITIAFRPVTEEPGDVSINAQFNIVLTLSPV